MSFYALPRQAQCSGIVGGGENRSYHPSRQVQTGIGPVAVQDAEGALEYGRAGDVSLIAGAAVFAKVNAIGGFCAVSVFERRQAAVTWPMCCGCWWVMTRHGNFQLAWCRV